MEHPEQALDGFEGRIAWPYLDGDAVGFVLQEMSASAQKGAARRTRGRMRRMSRRKGSR